MLTSLHARTHVHNHCFNKHPSDDEPVLKHNEKKDGGRSSMTFIGHPCDFIFPKLPWHVRTLLHCCKRRPSTRHSTKQMLWWPRSSWRVWGHPCRVSLHVTCRELDNSRASSSWKILMVSVNANSSSPYILFDTRPTLSSCACNSPSNLRGTSCSPSNLHDCRQDC